MNLKKYDLVVVGGGLSGVAAAVAAAREGLDVLIVEQSGAFGGAINTQLVFPYMKHWDDDPTTGERTLYSAGLFSEMKRREKELSDNHDTTWYRDRIFAPEYLKIALDQMIMEAGVDVLFHTTLVGVKTEGESIRAIEVHTKSGFMTLQAPFFVDATGDGDLFALAGCEFQLGRESDGLCQPMTTCFRCSGVKIDQMYEEDEKFLDALYKEYRAQGKIKNPRENIWFTRGIDTDVVHFNSTRIIKCDPTNVFEVSRAELESRAQILELHRFLKEHSPAYKDAKIISIATHIGVRESRKLKGVHILTAEELKDCVKFEDSIACGNYDIDIHNPSGTGTYIHVFEPGTYYTIPYRSLLPKEYTNLVVAGRCLSATHEAHSAVRIMSTCACMGEAAGTAIGVAKNTGKNVHTVDVQAVRQKLKDYGAFV